MILFYLEASRVVKFLHASLLVTGGARSPKSGVDSGLLSLDSVIHSALGEGIGSSTQADLWDQQN